MTVFFNKARNRWQYEFQLAGVRHSKFCFDAAGDPVTSRRAAQDAEAEAKRLARMAPKLPSAADLTLAQAINDLSEGWMLTPEWPNKKRVALDVLAFFKPQTAIRDISAALCNDFIVDQLKKPIMIWTGGANRKLNCPNAERFWKPHPKGKMRTNATVNRALPLLRAVFQRAYDTRDPITRERAIDEIPVIKDLPEPKRRARPTPEPVMQRLNELLPKHAIDGLVVTLCFGFRSGEAFGLVDHQVDWAAEGVRLFSEDVKDKTDVFLPGSQFAMGYLRCLAMEADARGVKHLITYRREATKNPDRQEPWRPIKKARTAWRTAMDTIEREFGRRWRWHDLRAAYITHIAVTCGPLAAQTMARHADFDTTRAYIEVADEMTRTAADRASERPALGLVQGGKS